MSFRRGPKHFFRPQPPTRRRRLTPNRSTGPRSAFARTRPTCSVPSNWTRTPQKPSIPAKTSTKSWPSTRAFLMLPRPLPPPSSRNTNGSARSISTTASTLQKPQMSIVPPTRSPRPSTSGCGALFQTCSRRSGARSSIFSRRRRS